MATELGKAYVQIVPSMRGMSESITKELDGSAGSSGKSAGGKIAGAIKGAIAAAGIGKILSSALAEGSALEQSLGGVETLYKENADKVIANAQNAYKTAGLSANAYMESVTSFSASLLQSLGGDTQKAADAADMALRDMSDNANKFGTDMESIQYAYQGFAKQNYTMLDNLKLGYGGTKSEMERLLADAEKLTGTKYDINSLNDVYSAIHAVQTELGVTGTTAKEAGETLGGSMAALKASWSNFLGALTTGGDMSAAVGGLQESFVTAAKNIIPAFTNIVTQLPSALLDTVITITPTLAQAAIDMVNGILGGLTESAPALLDGFVGLVGDLAQTIIDNAPSMIASAVSLISTLADGLINALPDLINRIPQLVEGIHTGFVDNIATIGEAGVKLFGALLQNLPQIIVSIISAIPKIITSIVNALTGFIGTMANVGLNLIKGLWSGISDAADWLWGKISGFFSGITDRIKKFFGIASPSKLFAEYGKYLDEGFAQGIAKNTSPIMDAIDDVNSMTAGGFNADLSMTARVGGSQAAGYAAQKASDNGAILSAIYSLIDVMQNKEFVAELDGQRISKAVTKYQNQMARGYGV